jgi:hypothetical protein
VPCAVGERGVLFVVPDGLRQSQPDQIATQTSTLTASRSVLERGRFSRLQGRQMAYQRIRNIPEPSNRQSGAPSESLEQI